MPPHYMASSSKRKGGDELTSGQRIAEHYRIERPIAEGGMASIYLATDLRSGQPVAVKCLYTRYDDNAIVRARFIDEGRIQMMLQHPNILRVLRLIESPVLAFVMEYVDGGTLEDHLQESGPLSLHEILEVMIPVMSGLGLAHSRGIIHRDLKPSNILVTRTGTTMRPKVMDFGVAKLNRTKNLTATGTTVGTLHYMSPEQIVGAKSIDGRADIYSLGITLYKLCAGEVPFNASTEFALMMAQVEAPPTPPSELNPEVAPGLEQVILKALAKRPQDRYQSVKEMTSALVELRDIHGNETVEMIAVPTALLQYAMMADGVAVDRTDEIVTRSSHVYDEESALQTLQDVPLDDEGIPDFSAGADTDRDLMPLDTQAITTEHERLSSSRNAQVFDSSSTMEVDIGVMEELRERDAYESGPLPTYMRSEEADRTLRTSVDIESLRRNLLDDSDDAITTQASLSDDDVPTTPMQSPSPQEHGPGGVSDHDATVPVRGEDVRRAARRARHGDTQRAARDASRPDASGRNFGSEPVSSAKPPRTVGPMSVDTGEATRPLTRDEVDEAEESVRQRARSQALLQTNVPRDDSPQDALEPPGTESVDGPAPRQDKKVHPWRWVLLFGVLFFLLLATIVSVLMLGS